MAPITNIEDLRVIARKRVPKALFDYVDGGSYDELTLANNRNDLNAIRLRQRVLVDTSKRDLSTTMMGEKVKMPVAIAPTGLTGLLHGDGEILAARAADAMGIKFCLSTMSICSIEDVAGAIKTPLWYQLYVFKDRGFARAMNQVEAGHQFANSELARSLSDDFDYLGIIRRGQHVTVLYRQRSTKNAGEWLGRLVLGYEDGKPKIFGASIF